jgi:plastocyanin
VPLALHPRVRALTTPERVAVLGAALSVFLFAAGPVWRHRWEPDAAILWSYAVVPAGVFAAFLRRGTPRLVPVLAESILLSIVKFGITAFVLVTLWSFGTPPPAARPGRLLEDLLRSKSTKISSSEREAAAGGEAARLAAAQTVSVGDGGFSSKVIAVAPGTDVALRATDGRLHAVEVLSPDGRILRNVPVLGSGVPHLLSFEEISDGVSLRCAVHPGERADLRVEPGR